VPGAVLTLRDDRPFALLDRIEGPAYRRVGVRTSAGLDVVAYEWIEPVDHLTPLPRAWRRADER
jgi:hypothetical protein